MSRRFRPAGPERKPGHGCEQVLRVLERLMRGPLRDEMPHNPQKPFHSYLGSHGLDGWDDKKDMQEGSFHKGTANNRQQESKGRQDDGSSRDHEDGCLIR